MTHRPLEFHPDAESDAASALDWYSTRSAQAARGFLDELVYAFAQIQQSPDRWPMHRAGARRYLMRRFPFLIIYRVREDSIQIIAVAHGRRRPGYWKRRL